MPSRRGRSNPIPRLTDTGGAGKLIWVDLDRMRDAPQFGSRCMAPRHVGQGVEATWAMCFIEDGRESEPVYQSMCDECMSEIARDLGWAGAAAGADRGPL
jgi:hypothetical protein